MRDPIPTHFFVLVVVRLGRRFLIVQERKHGQLWYLPAGRVEPGETLFAAACRETLEETGIPVVLEGIIRIEHTPRLGVSASRLRVIFVARPADDSLPKDIPDLESLQAAWVTVKDLGDPARFPLRGEEVRSIFQYVERGGTIHPLGLLSDEGLPFAR
jgi:8-oxo-dGTP pyrophosphatase MutT (NUDIX family)